MNTSGRKKLKKWWFRYLILVLFLFFVLIQATLIRLLGQQTATVHSNPFIRKQDDSKHEILCRNLLSNQPYASAMSLWRLHENRILQGLIHPQDSHRLHEEWTSDLLEFLTPLLAYSWKPHTNAHTLKRLKVKLENRLRSPDRYPTIKVLVFGGSIVEGSGCDRVPPSYAFPHDNKKERNKVDFRSLQDCSWPFRLQYLSNMFLPNAIEIINLAVGGTHSRAAVPVLDHWLFPNNTITEEDGGPDIIINAYSANDNLPPAYHNSQNTTRDSFHFYRVMKRLQEFISSAQSSRTDCKQPWIIFVNDYIGNQQESLIGESTLSEILQVFAFMESISVVTPSAMTSHYVLANTSEHLFTAPWTNKRGLPKIDVHFGMAGHVSTTIALAYAFLRWTVDYCQEVEQVDDKIFSDCQDNSLVALQPQDFFSIELPSKEWMKYHKPDHVIPNITEFSSNNPTKKDTSCTSSQHSCIFAFLAAPLGTHSQKGPLQEYINQYSVQSDGWQVQNNFRHGGFQNKLGLVALTSHARLHLRFPITTTTGQQKLTIHYLKSYGPEWENSRIQGSIHVQGMKSIVFFLDGYHEQNVSILYTHVVNGINVGGDANSLDLVLEIIGGQTFKINAMMLCG